MCLSRHQALGADDEFSSGGIHLAASGKQLGKCVVADTSSTAILLIIASGSKAGNHMYSPVFMCDGVGAGTRSFVYNGWLIKKRYYIAPPGWGSFALHEAGA